MSQSLAPVTEKPVVRVAARLLHQLKPHIAEAYIDSGKWNKFSITCDQLDLSGKDENGGGFLRLIRPEKMQQLASQYGFDSVRELWLDSDHLDRFLCAIHENKMLVHESKWRPQSPDDWEARGLRYLPDHPK